MNALAAAARDAASRGEAQAVFRAPWPVAGAALVACAAVAASSGLRPAFPPLAVLLLGSYAFSRRLERNGLGIWLLRAALFGLVLGAFQSRPPMSLGGYWAYDPRYVYPFGLLCAAEMVLQCWRRQPAGGTRGLGIVLLSTIVFACASNTSDEYHVRRLAPAYFTCLALAFADLRGARTLGMAVLLGAVGLGAAVQAGMHAYRQELSIWAMRLLQRPHPSEITGLSEAPTLGPADLTRGSRTRVLKLQGRCGELHLRALVFDTYWRGTWGPALGQHQLQAAPPAALNSTAEGDRLQVSRVVEDLRYLPAPLHCAGLVSPEGARPLWDPRRGGPLMAPRDSPVSYAVILSGEPSHQGPLCVPPGQEELARCLALPKDLDPRVLALAQQIGGALVTPAARVRAAIEYLGANHEYSLKTDPGRGDPVTNFLLQKRAAHCEYFASAAVLLLRCLDVPSRYVTGYYAHEFAGPKSMVVRGRDAHAWAEAWIAGAGWVTVEATPPAGLPLALPPVSVFDRAWEWLEERWTDAQERLAGVSWLGLLAWSAAAAAACGVAVRLWRRVRGWRRKAAAVAATAYAAPDEPVRVLAARFEELLRRKGVSCPQHRPWEEHLAAVAGGARGAEMRRRGGEQASGLDLGQARAFVEQYNAARFGGVRSDLAAARLRALLESLEGQ